MTYEELMRDVHRNKLPAWYHLYPDVPKITVLLGDYEYHKLLQSITLYSYQDLMVNNNNPSDGKFMLYDWDIINVATRSYQQIILSHETLNPIQKAGKFDKDANNEYRRIKKAV